MRRGSRLVLAALLPAALAGGSSAALIGDTAAPPPASIGDRGGSGRVGATGRLPQDRAPSIELLKEADDPRALATGAGPAVDVPDGPLGIPGPMLAAYRDAAQQVSQTDSSCGLHWSLLASIGRIESGHARSGRIDAQGTTVTAILGPRLDGGQGFAAIPDTDGGRYDGDPVWDRAVGPMQFIPSTWERYGVDGNDDGVASPHNVHDAVVSAGRYLCAGTVNMDEHGDVVRAVFRYNHSESYVREVLLWAAAYREGVRPLPVEVAPDVDNRDVLAGHRLSYRPLRLESAPPSARAPAPRKAASPPAPQREATAPPQREPATSAPAPSGEPSPPGEPEPGEPPPSGEPSTSQPPPSGTPPSSEPPPSSTPPSSEPPTSSRPPPSGDVAGSEGSTSPPTSSSPSRPSQSGESSPDEPVQPCQEALLDNGEFVTEERRPDAGPEIEPGTTKPGEADPGETVYVERQHSAPEGEGELQPCRVPSDYAAPE